MRPILVPRPLQTLSTAARYIYKLGVAKMTNEETDQCTDRRLDSWKDRWTSKQKDWTVHYLVNFTNYNTKVSLNNAIFGSIKTLATLWLNQWRMDRFPYLFATMCLGEDTSSFQRHCSTTLAHQKWGSHQLQIWQGKHKTQVSYSHSKKYTKQTYCFIKAISLQNGITQIRFVTCTEDGHCIVAATVSSGCETVLGWSKSDKPWHGYTHKTLHRVT